MKQPCVLMAFIAGTTFLISCGNHASDDSRKKADSTNTANIDSAKLRDTSAAHPVHMADLKPDADFAVAAADGGMSEVALGKLAETRGSSASVKKLAALMIRDHSKANLELKKLAGGKKIAIPVTMSNECQKKVADLNNKKDGKDFDKAYADLMVKDHKDAIEDFKKEAEKGNDKQVSEWAKGKVSLLEHHLMMAEQTQKKFEKQR